jgi:STE24 endopeptidase
MSGIYFYLIIGFYVYDFVSGQWLSHLNRTRMTPVMPRELEGIYDPEKYARQQMYKREHGRFFPALHTARRCHAFPDELPVAAA